MNHDLSKRIFIFLVLKTNGVWNAAYKIFMTFCWNIFDFQHITLSEFLSECISVLCLILCESYTLKEYDMKLHVIK